MTKVAAQQLGRYNINVNAICPGPTSTDFTRRTSQVRADLEGKSLEQVIAESAAEIPLGRFNDPEDIAAMAVFLATPGARNITGQSYNVDAGLLPF